MTKNGEGDITEVIENILKGREINERQRSTFFETGFWTVMSATADILKVPYSTVTIPRIFKEINKKSPNFFSKKGIDIPKETYSYQHPYFTSRLTPEAVSNEEKRRQIIVKKDFNESLDGPISQSYLFAQHSKDFDILSRALTLPPDIRNIYLGIGSSRIASLESAVKKHGNENDNMSVFMQVFDNHNKAEPLNQEAAKTLLDTGVDVWDFYDGARYGCGRVGRPVPDYKNKLKKILESFGNLKTVSEDAGINKRTLEDIEKEGVEIGFRDLRALQDYFAKQIGIEPRLDNRVRLVTDIPYIFTIERQFLPGTYFQATEPQIHAEWEGNIIYNWENGCNSIANQAEKIRSENPHLRVKARDLVRYLPTVS